jgi:hypothetical protein
VIIDSGASISCIPWRSWFTTFQAINGIAQLGSVTEVPILGCGDTGLVKSVRFIPALRIGIISIGQLDRDERLVSVFAEGKVYITDNDGTMVMSGTLDRKNQLYYLDREYLDIMSRGSHMDLVEEANAMQITELYPVWNTIRGSANRRLSSTQRDRSILDLLHLQWGHAPEIAIKRAVKNDSIVGSRVCYEDIKDLKLQFCEACQMGRMKTFTPSPELRRIREDWLRLEGSLTSVLQRE